MTSLHDAHGNPLLGSFRRVDADEDQHDVNAQTGDPHQLRHLGTMWVRQNRFEDEALTLREELMANRRSQFGRLVGTKVERRGQFVSIDEVKAARAQMRVVKRGFTRAVRPGYSHQ